MYCIFLQREKEMKKEKEEEAKIKHNIAQIVKSILQKDGL